VDKEDLSNSNILDFDRLSGLQTKMLSTKLADLKTQYEKGEIITYLV
jgi:hypothetical protein